MLNSNCIRLKACRKRGGLDQAELAQLVGLRLSSAISRLEGGQRTLDARTLIAYEIIFARAGDQLMTQTARDERAAILNRPRRLLLKCQNAPSHLWSQKVEFLEELIARLERGRTP
ncbi:helix-turn-helix domain-containing protein [Maricaulis sp.]|uniref:helix-turn-helix domain-containing protein n=1 Tax=Maricaulis sp. TaxID=1486257 RepID=UPI003A8FB3EF